MTTFWIVTAVLAIVVSATLGMALLRGRRPEGDAGDYDLRVYRDQLDAAPWDDDEKERVIDEVLVASRFTTELCEDLARAKAAQVA